jgi:hypothetical protein
VFSTVKQSIGNLVALAGKDDMHEQAEVGTDIVCDQRRTSQSRASEQSEYRMKHPSSGEEALVEPI